MINVLWISNIPSPYKVDLMNLLGQEVNLTCCFEYHTEENREESWYKHEFKNFKAIFLSKGIKELINLANQEYDLLINSDYSQMKCILLTLLFKIKKRPVLLQADGGIAINRDFFVNKAISMVMKLSTYYLSSGKETDKYFEFYGVCKEKIHHYRFSSLKEADICQHTKLSSQKEELRNQLNIPESKIILSIGQQIPRKGFDILIKAVHQIDNPELGVYIIGGKPQEELTKLIHELSLERIHFLEFMDKESLANYYACSDLFVLATREDIWGLVINEAMSFGLPIISTDKCIAAVEFNHLFNNGIVVPTENSSALAQAIQHLLTDEEFMETCKKQSLLGIQQYTIENTCLDYLTAIKKSVGIEK